MRYPLHFVLLAGLAFPGRVTAADYQLERAFPNLAFAVPTDIQAAPDGSHRIFVVEKTGAIKVFPLDYTAGPGDVKVFLDLAGKVRTTGEAGAVGLAFHPGYARNGMFFVFWVSQSPYRCIVARYYASPGGDTANEASETIILDVPKASVYHNGGQIAFGPDGYLYVGLGDDTIGDTAQDLSDLRGSILRINVDTFGPRDGGDTPHGTTPGGPAEALPYQIPPDNPFAGSTLGYRGEIFAYGFRNPWRFSIDPGSGELWVADVGEDTYEEIDLVEKGKNYGWPYMEGPSCLDAAACQAFGATLAAPYYSYDHSEGSAVIGGHRYRGTRLPELAGLFVFADFTGGKVWALQTDGPGAPQRVDLVTDAPTLLTFGAGPTGELYAASMDGYIYHLARTVTSVGGGATRRASRLVGNFPNPFNPATTIRYQVAAPARVAIEIVSVRGERLHVIDEGLRAAGVHDTAWRGEIGLNARAASGVYFYRLLVDGRPVDTRRMVLLQ